MKGRITVAAILVMIVSFVVFGFVNKKETKKECSVAINTDKRINNLNSFNNKLIKEVPKRALNYSVRGAKNRTITKSELQKAQTLDDIIVHFPSNWIEEYVSVEIYRITKNEEVKELGKDITLTTKQQLLFKNTNIGDDVIVNVIYKSKNSVTNKDKKSETKVTMTVVPEVQANFINKKNDLKQFLIQKSTKDIQDLKFKQMQSAAATFTINETGEVTDVKVVKSTGVISIDTSIIELLQKMPKWSPAKENNKPVKQNFEFTIGNDGC